MELKRRTFLKIAPKIMEKKLGDHRVSPLERHLQGEKRALPSQHVPERICLLRFKGGEAAALVERFATIFPLVSLNHVSVTCPRLLLIQIYGIYVYHLWPYCIIYTRYGREWSGRSVLRFAPAFS